MLLLIFFIFTIGKFYMINHLKLRTSGRRLMLVCKVWPLIRNPSGCKDTKKSATSIGNRGFLAFLSYLSEFPECHTLVHLDVLKNLIVIVVRKALHKVKLFEGGAAHRLESFI